MTCKRRYRYVQVNNLGQSRGYPGAINYMYPSLSITLRNGRLNEKPRATHKPDHRRERSDALAQSWSPTGRK